MIHATHTYCRAVGSGAVTACFYDLDLLRWDSNIQPSNIQIHSTTAAVKTLINAYLLHLEWGLFWLKLGLTGSIRYQIKITFLYYLATIILTEF